MYANYEDDHAFEVNVNDPDDLEFWADQFDLSEARLKEIVEKVGKSVENITTYLNSL